VIIRIKKSRGPLCGNIILRNYDYKGTGTVVVGSRVGQKNKSLIIEQLQFRWLWLKLIL